MRISFLVAGLLAGTSWSLATPQRRGQRKSFTLTATKSTNGDFLKEMAAARRKWGIKGHQGMGPSAASAGNKDGVVEVHPGPMDIIYTANVEMGEPPQIVKLAMDTGSADLWTQSSDTIYLWNQDGPWAPQYKANLSKTAYRVPGSEWNVSYVDGSGASGYVYLDTLRLGDFQVPSMAIESAKYISRDFEADTGLSGILGLAKSLRSRISPSTPTLIERLRPLLERPVFSVDLRHDAPSYFDFGHIDEDKIVGNITWVDTNSDSKHWDIFLDLTRWEGSVNNPWHKYAFNATIDTGTTLLYLPPTLATAYWYDVPNMRIDARYADAFTFECAIADNLPDLIFKLPGTEHQLRIPGPYLNFGPLNTDDDYCWGGMQSAAGLSGIIMGDTALRAFYVVFDIETGRVGFANKKM